MTKIRTHLERQLQGSGTTPPAMIPVEAPGPAHPQRGAEVGGWAVERVATRANINQVVIMLIRGCSVECFQEYANSIENERCVPKVFAEIQFAHVAIYGIKVVENLEHEF